jgi:acylaminoacyl-peptidase
MTMKRAAGFCLAFAILLASAQAAEKPKLTIDEFFNSVEFSGIQLSPDGHSVVIATERADWNQHIYRDDLWLYRDGPGSGGLVPLTQSGHDSAPRWSPDGRWIAFLSDRKPPKSDSSDEDSKEDVTQLYLISPAGGEAFPVTQGGEEVHAFAWSPDSQTLYFATRQPWTKSQQDDYKKEWKDTIQYRAAERGDTIFSLRLTDSLARRVLVGSKPADDSREDVDVTPGSLAVAKTPWSIQQLEASPDGKRLAFVTTSVSGRWEKVAEFEIYTVDLGNASPDRPPDQVTHNEAIEQEIRWADDSKHIFFEVEYGSVAGRFDVFQTRLHWVDADSGKTERWAKSFTGALSMGGYALLPGGGPLLLGRLGTEVQPYLQSRISADLAPQPGWPGTFESLTAASHSPRIAFVHSSWERPAEVYLAEGPDKLAEARPITSFNKLLSERELPRGKTYRWTAEDGATIEGVLLYPPGKFEAKDLPLFVFIHGGPDDADGSHFEADWYVWDRLAADQGWLVFEPNYRGSTGYGDKFLAQIVPELLTRPGKDILEGVDALVKDGIADPNHLAVGGYSYGGYLTNWLITQTPRFRAAVTGAGAVEHVANWGNDDTGFWDAQMLGGLPWEVPQRYQSEAAIFQINKVRTPTHIVVGGSDIRVASAEAYLLEHALHNLGVPSTLLIFPGEDHSLEKDPWHGKIKVREELKWLEKYGGVSAGP